MSKLRFARNAYYLIATGLLLGFGLATALRGNFGFTEVYTITQMIDMEKETENLESENAAIRASLTQLSQNLYNYQSSEASSGTVLSRMETELKRAELISGQVDLEGPGVEITLNDSTKKLEGDEKLQWFIIHDIDILEIVNELRAAGAEAIDINGVRVDAGTNIRCGGPTILIGNKRKAVPFVIRAIGDPTKLEAAMIAPGSYLDILEVNSIGVEIVKRDTIMIRHRENSEIKYMKKAEESGEK